MIFFATFLKVYYHYLFYVQKSSLTLLSFNVMKPMQFTASPETQGQLGGRSILLKTFTTNILSIRLTAPGSPRISLQLNV